MERGELSQFPGAPGVYAVYDKDGIVQYIGLSRQVAQSVSAHIQELPELTHSVRVAVLEAATRETLTNTWKEWVTAAVTETGCIPPGNAQGETKWQARSVARATRPEIKLTAGKALVSGVTISDLLEQVVKGNKSSDSVAVSRSGAVAPGARQLRVSRACRRIAAALSAPMKQASRAGSVMDQGVRVSSFRPADSEGEGRSSLRGGPAAFPLLRQHQVKAFDQPAARGPSVSCRDRAWSGPPFACGPGLHTHTHRGQHRCTCVESELPRP
ncbi:MAG: hypothetical protein WDW38_000154 [Sanguina aurantia]